jgi:hypothetical protein
MGGDMGPKLKLLVSLTCAVLLGAAPSRASTTTYSYTGPNYNGIEGSGILGFPPYTTSMNVTGSFTVAAPLINLSDQDITSSILSFSFFDGINTITSNNATSYAFTVSTDAFGNLTAWDIGANIGSLASPLDVEQGISTHFVTLHSPAGDEGFVAICAFSPCTPGSDIVADVGSAVFNNPSQIPGIWTETPLPAALPLFATGIGGLGLLGWRRKGKARAVA